MFCLFKVGLSRPFAMIKYGEKLAAIPNDKSVHSDIVS